MTDWFDQECIDASYALETDSVQTSGPVAWIGSDSAHTELTALTDEFNQPVYLSDPANGFYAQAFRDNYGNIIIAYQGSDLDPLDGTYALNSEYADLEILNGQTPKALDEAVLFANLVHSEFSPSPIYVTGHSLGGAEAEEAASQCSFVLGGDTFAAPGLPGYIGPSNGSLQDYVDSGDPVGNYAKDTTWYALTGDHFGTVVPADNSVIHLLGGFIKLVPSLSELLTLGAFHPLNVYAMDLRLLPFASSSVATVLQPMVSPNLAFYIYGVIQSTPIQPTSSNLKPIITGPSNVSASTSANVSLSSLFTATETPTGSSNQIDHY